MTFTKTVSIQAPTSIVWETLTRQELMQQWMFETPIEIITDWQLGHPFIIRGDVHSMPFENSGTLLQFTPLEVLQYSHLSSLSGLPDIPESYAVVEFRLAPMEDLTILTLTLQ
jgi:uncharacterized protein YndB with AHSA1/START domain